MLRATILPDPRFIDDLGAVLCNKIQRQLFLRSYTSQRKWQGIGFCSSSFLKLHTPKKCFAKPRKAAAPFTCGARKCQFRNVLQRIYQRESTMHSCCLALGYPGPSASRPE